MKKHLIQNFKLQKLICYFAIIFGLTFTAAGNVNIKTNFSGGTWWPSLNIEITNTGTSAIDSWELEFDFQKNITYFDNAQIKSNSSGHYVLGSNPWGGAISPGQTVNISGGFSGGSQMPSASELPASIKFNGSAIGGENSPPLVSITAPTNGSVIEQETLSPVDITTAASDSDGTVESIKIEVDEQTFNSSTATWTPSAFGNYTIQVTAIDNEGSNAIATISLTIKKESSEGNVLVKGWPNYITMGSITNASKTGYEVTKLEGRFNSLPSDINTTSVFTYSGEGGAETWNLKYVDEDLKIGRLYTDLISELKSKTNKIINPVVVIYTAGGSNGPDSIGFDLGIHNGASTPEQIEMNENNMNKWLHNLIKLSEYMEDAYNTTGIRGTIILNPDLLGELHKIEAGIAWAPFDYNNPNVKLKTTLDYLKTHKNIELPAYPAFITDNGTISDYLLTINWLIKTKAPNIPFGWMDNIWAGTTLGHKWVHRPEMLQTNIDSEVNFLKSLKIYDDTVVNGENIKADYIAFDKYERDNFGTDDNALNNGYTYNVSAWNTYFAFIAGVDNGISSTPVPVMLFQTPGGHIQINDDIDIRNNHGSTAPNYIFGDSLLDNDLSNAKDYIKNNNFSSVATATVDYNFASKSVLGYLNNNKDSQGWTKGHLEELENANVFSILWGGGNTTGIAGLSGVTDDSGWLSDKINEYYLNTTPDNTSARDDSFSTDYNTAAVFNVLQNDSYGSELELIITTAPLNGSAVVNSSNQIEYTPSTDFTGTDSFTYTINDGNGGNNSANVTVTVKEAVTQTYTITASLVNSGGGDSYPEYKQPTGGHDVYMKGAKVTFNGSAYESVIDNNSWSPTVYSTGWKSIPQGGGSSVSGSISPNGDVTVNKEEVQTFTMTPDSGNRVKDVKVDGSSVGLLTSYTFTNVTANHTISAEFEAGTPPVNNVPVANSDSATVDAGQIVTINVLSNDSDADGDTLTIESITQGGKGNVVLSNNSIMYTADSAEDGSDSFSYTINDGKGGSDTATVNVTINGTPEPIELLASNDTVSTIINTPITIDALINDTGDQINIDSNTSPGNGTVSISNNKLIYTPSSEFTGDDSFNYTIIDKFGQFATALISISVREKSETNNVIIGYWHNWGSADAPYLRLKDVNSKYNVIDVSFAEPVSSTDMTMKFAPEMSTESEFKSDIQILQSRNVKVLISIGGEKAHIRLNTTADKDKFVTSMIDIIEEYGFDGLDIDFEGGALNVESGDFTNPTSALAVNTIDAVKEIVQYFKGQGKDFWVTAAPETAYLQGALSAYGGIWGAYIPLLYALGDDLTYVAPQLYNSGSMMGLDNQAYAKGNADFIVAMIECLTNGMEINGKIFKLSADQVAVGLPATPAAAYNNGSYIAPTEVIKALDYLTKGESFGGAYVLRDSAGYPDLRGMMTWSINWDNTTDGGTTVDEFAETYSNYFNIIEPPDPGEVLTANDDSAVTITNSTKTINPLINDTDPENDPITIISNTQPKFGSATFTAASVIYTPNTGFTGTDSFNYTISDGNNNIDSATITVTVQDNSITKGDIYYHLTLPVDIKDNSEKLVLDGGNYDDLIMSNYVAGALFGHLVRNNSKFGGVKFNREYLYGSILAQLLQENLSTFSYVNTSNWINPDQTIREMLLKPGQGGPYQINDYAKRLGGDKKSGGLGLINYSVLQKKLGYKIAAQDDNSQTGKTGPDSLADKYFGPMATTYFHYNSLNRLDNINTPSYGPSAEFWSDCMNNLEGNLEDNFFDMIINAAYNAGPWSAIIKTYIELGSKVTDSSTETQNRIKNINNYMLTDQEYKDILQTDSAPGSTFIIYPRQVRFYCDELYNNPGIQSFHPTSNVVVFDLNVLKDIFAKSMGTLAYVNSSNSYVLISYNDAAAAYDSARTSLALSNVSSLDLGNSQDRNKIFDLLDTAVDTLAESQNINFASVTEVDLVDGTPQENTPPTAGNDSVSTDKNIAVTVNALSNDSDVDGDSLTITSVTTPQNGTVTNTDSTIAYTPNNNFDGTDSFNYTISDGQGGTANASVTVTVNNPVVQTYKVTASVISSTGGGEGSYPEYIQPTGGHDVYMKGDKVTFNGNAYESVIDNNSWSPTVYPGGWKSIPNGDGGGSTTFSGTISPSNEVTVEKGKAQAFTITPDSGSKIKNVKVDGSSVGLVTSYNFNNVSANHTIVAEFEEGQQPANKIPTVNFSNLTDGQIIKQKTLTSISIEINSADEDGTVASETITVEGQTHAGSAYNWTPSGFGTFAVSTTVTDNNGATADKTISVTIEQQIGNISPTVSFVQPTNQKTITQETLSPVTIEINGSDEDGSIASIAVEVEGQTFTESPAQWTPSKFADHQVTVTVTDNEGATAIALITVTIQQGTTPEPSKKQVVGYITQWDAWKSTTFGVPEQGVFNQLNVDYSKYTILNFSFFGVAKDGSLHSGDYRNKQMSGTNRTADQEPADLLHSGLYSSWDYWILYGDLDLIQHVGESDTALQQRLADYGFSVEGTSWTNSITGLSGSFPVPLPKENGDPGLIKLCKQNNVKLMASLGGWSMSKHFHEMAADPAKKARFLDDCEKLINMGFDGIDIDWEYPGPSDGMNFTGTQEDYHNYTLLMKDIRERIGDDKLITAAFSAAPAKLADFEWTELDKYMDYYNMMTYDLGGGWSTVAEHNSPLYGAASWDNTFKYLTQTLNVKSDKINMGVAFYGRGVETNSTADLGAATKKSQKAFSVDGTLSSAADFTNWKGFEGAPNYAYLLDNSADWEYRWDSTAQVPYKLKEGDDDNGFFLSYDNEQSIDLKAEYVNDNNAGGVIIWQVFGDWDFSEAVAQGGAKLKKYSNVKTPLLDVLNNTFTN